MIRTAINPDGDKEKMPIWAVKYLEKNDLSNLITALKKNRRHDAFFKMMKVIGKVDHSNVFYFNKKGDVVFFWPTAAEKTFFLYKWS